MSLYVKHNTVDSMEIDNKIELTNSFIANNLEKEEVNFSLSEGNDLIFNGGRLKLSRDDSNKYSIKIRDSTEDSDEVEIFNSDQPTSKTSLGNATEISGEVNELTTKVNDVTLFLRDGSTDYKANLIKNGNTYTLKTEDRGESNDIMFTLDSDGMIEENSIKLNDIKVNDLQVEESTGNLAMPHDSDSINTLVISKATGAKVSTVNGITVTPLNVANNVNSVIGSEITKVTTNESQVNITGGSLKGSTITLKGNPLAPSGLAPDESGTLAIPLEEAVATIIPPSSLDNFTIVVKSIAPFIDDTSGDLIFTKPSISGE